MTAGAIAGTTRSLHTITEITGDVQARPTFYVGLVGLKLVDQMADFADAEKLRLVSGDEPFCCAASQLRRTHRPQFFGEHSVPKIATQCFSKRHYRNLA